MTDRFNTDIYEEVQHEDLPDIHAEGILLKHKKSGARIALVPCEDKNKVFYIAFRTPPADSTGVAHIIEHTVLCGSEKYPLKDPFIELLKGSLNTYLNATTYPDKTMFPVASTNDRDFRNLTDVYLDAVFHPNIYHEEYIFRQEGWSLRMQDADAPLEMSGVVYNEMKGAFSNPEEILSRRIFSALFPDTPYGVESGGDPEHIPDLTYEAFLDFHRKYYHPSNSYIYFYGDMDLAETLEYLDREYLSHYDVQEFSSAIPFQKCPETPVREQIPFPVAGDEETEGKSYLSLNFVTGDLEDLPAQIAMDVLDYALFSMPGAPVRRALIDAGIGDDVYGSYSDGILQPYFSIVARNAEAEEEEQFLNIIRSALEKEVSDGIDKDALLAGISSMEFQFREADYMTWPKGLIYGIDMMDSWLYNELEPFTALKQLGAFKVLRERVSDGSGYFENLVKEKFLENPHHAVITLYPVRGMQEEADEALRRKMEDRKAAMSEEEIAEVVRKTKELKIWQEEDETDEALDSVPRLHLSDISRDALVISNIDHPVSYGTEGKTVETVLHKAVTNGIGYTQLLFRADDLMAEDLPYLAVLRSVLMNIDTKRHSYFELINRINQRTGGISVNLTNSSNFAEGVRLHVYFNLLGRALYEENGFLADTTAEILTETNFEDHARLGEILAEIMAHTQMYLAQSGHSAAATRALSSVAPEYRFGDAVSGIEFYHSMERVSAAFEKDPAALSGKLESLARQLFKPENLIVSYTADEKSLETFDDGIRTIAERLAAFSSESNADVAKTDGRSLKDIEPLKKNQEGFYTGGQVQNVAVGFAFDPEECPSGGTLLVLRHLLNTGYLWDTVRVDGNAYGCTANIMKKSGTGVMVSFRDPHLEKTVNAYKALADYLDGFRADEEEMEKYIIGTISNIDVPLTASLFGNVSMRYRLRGISQEEIGKEREEILSVTAEKIRNCALFVRKLFEKYVLCVIGSETSIRKHEDLFDRIGPLFGGSAAGEEA